MIVDRYAGNDKVVLSAAQIGNQTLQVTAPAWLRGGDGNDTLTGGFGHDTLTGGHGNDRLTGGLGVSVLAEAVLAVGETVTVTNTALKGNVSGLGSDVLSGFQRAVVRGGAGNDKLDFSKFTRGAVSLFGGAGDDSLIGGSGDDFFDTDGLVSMDALGAEIITGGLGSNTAADDPLDTWTQVQGVIA